MDRRTLRQLFPRPVRALPADLTAALVLTGATVVAALAPGLRETPIRVPLGLVLVLFVPGYVFVAALFPEAGGATDGATDAASTDASESTSAAGVAGVVDDDAGGEGIDGVERVALSFGLSVAISPLLGLVLNFTPWGIRLGPIVAIISGFVLVATAVAAVRRWQLPPADRFRVPYRRWYARARAEAFAPDSRADAALNVALAASVLLAVGSVGYAVAVPPPGEQFSAISLLTEDNNGNLVADGYPTNLTAGESVEVVVGVDNHEHRTVEYAIVAVEQRVSVADNETVVEEQRVLDRLSPTVAHNESWHHDHTVTPTLTGEDVRLVWLLFPDDEVPADPSTDDTPYSTHLWVDVAPAESTASDDGSETGGGTDSS